MFYYKRACFNFYVHVLYSENIAHIVKICNKYHTHAHIYIYKKKLNINLKIIEKKSVEKMENKKQLEETKRSSRSSYRSQSPRNRTPYDRQTTNANEDINDLRIQAIENSRLKSLNEEELAFKSILDEFKIKLDKLNFKLNNSESVIREYYIELRGKVQLTKELRILKLENQSEIELLKIDQYEQESLRHSISKVNNDEFSSKLNEMKSEYENLSKQLDERQTNIDKIKSKTSELIFEKDNLESLIFDGKLVEFKESEDHDLGELYSNEIDIFENKKVKSIDLSNHFKKYNEKCDHYFASFTSDGDIIMITFGFNTFEISNYLILHLIDINKNVVKKSKQIADDLYHDYGFSYEVTTDKIFLVVTTCTEDKLAFVLNKDLDVIKKAYLDYSYFLIGASDSFLFFWYESETEKSSLKVLNWKLEMEIREIDKQWQNSDSDLPFYASFQDTKHVETSGRYCFIRRDLLIIVDKTTGLVVNKIKTVNFFISNCASYLILIDKESIKFSDLDGNKVWRELKLDEKFIGSDWIINKDNKLCCFNARNKLLSIQQN
jgi:hypothetical protein